MYICDTNIMLLVLFYYLLNTNVGFFRNFRCHIFAFLVFVRFFFTIGFNGTAVDSINYQTTASNQRAGIRSCTKFHTD